MDSVISLVRKTAVVVRGDHPSLPSEKARVGKEFKVGGQIVHVPRICTEWILVCGMMIGSLGEQSQLPDEQWDATEVQWDRANERFHKDARRRG